MNKEVKQCLPLKTGIIYGPVHSRRLGESLGINLSPTQRKICSFNCVYCHYGWSSVVTLNSSKYSDEFPEPDDVFKALEGYLKNNPKPDYITFLGNGEPSTHPRFAEIVTGVLEIRNRIVPDVRVTILSNSTTVRLTAHSETRDANIIKALNKLDIRFMKLDCGEEATFKRFNRPAKGISLSGIIESLKKMKMPIIIQTLIADGEGGNYNDESIKGYIEALSAIKPESVQLYSLDRPTPDGSLIGLTKEQLREIADRITAEVGVGVEIFGRRSDRKD